MVYMVGFRILGPLFHEFLTPVLKEKCRFLLESAPATWILANLCLKLFVITSHMQMIGYQPYGLSTQQLNDHRSQLIGSSLFCYNSLAAAAREVFKPSPDSASLVVSSQKKIFQFWFRGSLGGASQVGVFSRFYGLL